MAVFCPAKQRKEASDYAKKLLNDLLAPYGKHFALKDENADEFIGLKITDTENDVFIEPISHVSIVADGYCRRVRFQHLCSNGGKASKIAVLYSQLVSTVGRCNAERFIQANVVKLTLEFAYAGFPYFAMKKVVLRFMWRYRYRIEVNAGFCIVLQRADILLRNQIRPS